jgi:hypothetical protein
MSTDTHTLIWLFPVAFMFHDFEEIIFWELWLNKHGDEVKRRLPVFLAKRVSTIVGKSTAQASLPIGLIFSLTVLSSLLATEHQTYGFFLLASGGFFIHGFMHVGQAVALRRYIPAVITSAVIVIPYGLMLYGRLIGEGIVNWAGLFIYFLLGAVLMVPFILVMHAVGDYMYTGAVRLLIH